MKSAGIFILGIVVGAVCVYFFDPLYKTIYTSKSEVLIVQPEKMPEESPPTDTSINDIEQIENESRHRPEKLTIEATTENISLPTSNERDELQTAFEKALSLFDQENIDYDWANQNEIGMYDELNFLPKNIASSFISFQCREAHCLLELSDTDFNQTWGLAFGQLSEQGWWQFGRIHFQPYPIPNSKASYQLVMERLNKQQ